MSEAGFDAVNKGGWTPLHIAASSHFSGEIVKTLIKGGANINAADKYGDTPLHLAINICSDTNIEILMENGVDSSLKNKDGKTSIGLDTSGYVAQLAREKEQKKLKKIQERKEFLQVVQLHY